MHEELLGRIDRILSKRSGAFAPSFFSLPWGTTALHEAIAADIAQNRANDEAEIDRTIAYLGGNPRKKPPVG